MLGRRAMLGADTNEILLSVPLLGNRVDRFVWNGSALIFDRNLITLRVVSGRRRAGSGGPGRCDAERARRTTTAACSRSAPTASSTSSSAISAGAASCRTCRVGPDAHQPPTTSSAGPEPDDAHLTGVDPAAERRRVDADRQPILRRGRGDRRRGGRQHPEDVRLRPPQQLRHGIRPASGQPVGPGERRGRVRRDQPGGAGHERRLDPDHGPGGADRAVQGRSSSPCRRPEDAARRKLQQLRWPPTNIADTPAAGALAAVHRCRGRATAIRSSAGSSPCAPGGHRLPQQPRARAAVPPSDLFVGSGDAGDPRAATCSAST